LYTSFSDARSESACAYRDRAVSAHSMPLGLKRVPISHKIVDIIIDDDDDDNE